MRHKLCVWQNLNKTFGEKSCIITLATPCSFLFYQSTAILTVYRHSSKEIYFKTLFIKIKDSKQEIIERY